MTNEEAINALTMCQELMLFDPMTGETTELWQENKDNQDLYNACSAGIAALQAQSERENRECSYCKNGARVIPVTQPDGTFIRFKRYCDECGRPLKEGTANA